MTGSVEIFSNLNSSMSKIHEAHWESGMEAQSKMGFVFKDSMEKALKSHKTQYTTTIVDGKKIIIKSGSHDMGERINPQTGKLMDTPSMGNFIQWRSYSSTGTTVVGGLMKKGWTEDRKEGKIVGRRQVFGVGQNSIDILEKISTGKVGKALWNREDGKRSTKSMDIFEGTHVAHPTFFIKDGKNKAMNGARARLRRYLRDAIKARDNLKSEPMIRKS